MKPIVELDSVSIELGKERIVEQLSFSLNEGDIGCLLGPSGCGKTTLLRTIAGFSEVTSGSIRLYGEEVASTKVQMPTEQRQIGMMFQDFALFPHLTQ